MQLKKEEESPNQREWKRFKIIGAVTAAEMALMIINVLPWSIGGPIFIALGMAAGIQFINAVKND